MNARLAYRLQRLVQDSYNLWVICRDFIYYRLIRSCTSPYDFLHRTEPQYTEKKRQLLARTQQVPTICFAFRGIHWIDFFIPIHLELRRLYGDQYCVVYMSDLQSTLKKNMSSRLSFYQTVRQNLRQQGIADDSYFDIEELPLFEQNFSAEILLFCENMNHIQFHGLRHRVYIPHYCVVKAKDRATFSGIKNLDMHHVFIPSKGTYFYTRSQMRYNNPDTQLHPIGYPKLELVIESVQGDAIKNPVIYAPSLEKEVLFDALDQGILDVFASLPDIHFLIKLHPSIEGYKGGVGHIFHHYKKKYANITIDNMTAIHKFAHHSQLLITDFGSVGAEYKLLTGKPVIYLQVPAKYLGGSDLEFRDSYAEALVSVSELQATIVKTIGMDDSDDALATMRSKTLFHYGEASSVAAKKIVEIVSL